MSGSSSAIQSDNTTAQNIATAINGLINIYLQVQGAVNYPNITTSTVVSQRGGRLCSISVIDAGSGDGMIYDTVSPTAVDKPLCVIPTADGVGVKFVNLPAGYGIRVDPGTGQIITISYSVITVSA